MRRGDASLGGFGHSVTRVEYAGNWRRKIRFAFRNTTTYNSADVLTKVTDFNGNAITVANTADGLPNSLTLGSSGDRVTTGYDNTDSPQSINLKQGSSVLLGFSYSDAPSGDTLSESDTGGSGGSPAYTYDSQGQLSSMTVGSSTSTYGQDASANLTPIPADALSDSAATYDDAGELTSSAGSGTTYVYNADGELTAEKQGSTTTVSAGWDGSGAMTRYNNSNSTSGTGANMTSATYDGNGQRVSETSPPRGDRR